MNRLWAVIAAQPQVKTILTFGSLLLAGWLSSSAPYSSVYILYMKAKRKDIYTRKSYNNKY
jgi:hypothetical protein